MRFLSALLLCLLPLQISAQVSDSPPVKGSDFENKQAFATWQGIEPDKWATVWLIKRYLSPEAVFSFYPPNSSLPQDVVSFGVNSAALKRSNRQSMFHLLVSSAGITEPVVQELDRVIYDLEVNIWETPEHERSAWIEALYRQLQERYRRDQVPVDCYLEFFDGVAELLAMKNVTARQYDERLSLSSVCPGIKEPSRFVEQLDHLEVLREISLGKRVVFIDTRENQEYSEMHLPGAQQLALRDVNAQSVAALKDADLIVPYCIKDFRGFEVAKAIKLNGGGRVATLSPNGLKGWLNAKLPMVNESVSEQEAKRELMQCAMEPKQCLVEAR